MQKNSEIVASLADLLKFISQVATTIRMYSAYNSKSINDPETPQAVMWLSDALHSLNYISSSLMNEDKGCGIEDLIDSWKHDAEKINKYCKPNGLPCMDIQEGIDILEKLHKALINAATAKALL